MSPSSLLNKFRAEEATKNNIISVQTKKRRLSVPPVPAPPQYVPGCRYNSSQENEAVCRINDNFILTYQGYYLRRPDLVNGDNFSSMVEIEDQTGLVFEKRVDGTNETKLFGKAPPLSRRNEEVSLQAAPLASDIVASAIFDLKNRISMQRTLKV